VLAHHVPPVDIPWIAHFQDQARHGVSLFFVISGYIVMTLMLREVRRSGAVDVRSFLVRRILRLWPLYYVVLLLEAVLVFGVQVYSPHNQALFSDKLPCYALYCSNWLATSGEGPFFVSWSLAVEEQFYLFLSLLLLVLRPSAVVAAFGALLAVKILLVNAVRVLLSYSEAILLGVLLAFLLNDRDWYGRFSRLTASRFVPAACLLLLLASLVFGGLGNKSGPDALGFYLICALLVGACAVGNELPVIGGRALSAVGLFSYGIYLLHMPVLSAVKRFTEDPVAVLVLTLAIVLPVAWASYRYFEEPIRRLGHRRPASADASTRLQAPPTNDDETTGTIAPPGQRGRQ
jgi:peptidoglycan/LPS O-acetylase OafA/YrhL